MKKHEMRNHKIRKGLACVSIFLISHFSFLISSQAQPVTHHNCWDIDLAPAEQFLPTPYIIASADTGMLVIAMGKQYLGTPYRYGGRSPKGFDCAGFVLFLYRHFGHDLPGWCSAQARLGIEVEDTRNLQPGDLVFFGGRHSPQTIGHTGLVVSTDPQTGVFTFIHSATHGGVIVSRSTEPYYADRYLTARRILR